MSTYQQIMQSLKKGQWQPIYFLQGEEPYYIQQISDYIGQHALTEAEQSFNQSVLYGRDLDIQTLLDNLRRLPMMSSHQVVILREAQAMRDFANKMEAYWSNPVPSTIFVVQFMGKKIRGNSKAANAIKKNGVLFTADKVRDYKLVDWIQQHISTQGKQIEPKAALLLAEYLGNDLSQIVHSLEKLEVNEVGDHITAVDIEKYVGISKDYNIFELNNALMERQRTKAFTIIRYFGANPKACPFPVLMGGLYGLFSRLLILHGLPTHDKKAIASKLRVNPYFVNDYLRARQQYSVPQLRQVMRVLSEFDLKFKGVGSVERKDAALMQEMVAKILL